MSISQSVTSPSSPQFRLSGAFCAFATSCYLYLIDQIETVRQVWNTPGKTALPKQLVGYVIDQYSVDSQDRARRSGWSSNMDVIRDPVVLSRVHNHWTEEKLILCRTRG